MTADRVEERLRELCQRRTAIEIRHGEPNELYCLCGYLRLAYTLGRADQIRLSCIDRGTPGLMETCHGCEARARALEAEAGGESDAD